MKKNTLKTLVFLIGLNFQLIAQAGENPVVFAGAVTEATCNTNIVQDENNESNNVYIGQVPVSAPGETTYGSRYFFTIESLAVDGGECATTGSVDVYWSSPSLSNRGIENHTGSALDAYILLMSYYPTGGLSQVVTSSSLKTEFTNTEMKEGMMFRVRLAGGEIAGTVEASATYNVVYN